MLVISGWRAGKKGIFGWFEACTTRVISCTIVFAIKKGDKEKGETVEGEGEDGKRPASSARKVGKCVIFI